MQTRFLLPVARRFTSIALILFAAACATFAPARHATTAIADADRVAKEALANENAIDPGKIPARTVSVLPFVVASRDTVLAPLSYAMSGFLTSDLARSDALTLVERERIDAIYRELDLIDAGIVDPATGPRVGRLVGARRVVIGSISTTPNGRILMGARVVDVISGTVQDVATGTVPMDGIFDGEKALALRLLEQLGVSVSPALRSAMEQRETSNLAAAVAFGRGLRAEAKGDLEAARRAFEDAARLDVGFAAARTRAAQVSAETGKTGSVSSLESSLDRVVNLTAQSINVPVTTKLPEAADAPAQSLIITLILTLRIS